MKLKNLIIFPGLLLVGCSHLINEKDSDYFNGNIMEANENKCQTKSVTWNELILKGPNYGDVYVHDSIMVFYNTKLGNKFFNVFNVDTGEELGRFCEKGNGPNEAVAYGTMYNFFKEECKLKTLLYAPFNNKISIWNITQSLEHKQTIITDIPYSWRKENNNIFYSNIYYLNEDALVAKNQAQNIGEDNITLPYYQKRSISTNQQIKKYDIYKKTIKNDDAYILPETFFYSNDAIKPDGSKVAMAMRNLPQINVIDLNTGEICGYRLKGGKGFSVFKEDGNLKIHYQWIHADDKYIYATYLGKYRNSNPRTEDERSQTIYVFDWEGNLKYRLLPKEGIGHFYVDSVRNRLYNVNHKTDIVSYIELDAILN